MQEFKSLISRLARLFRNGRDNWKDRALEKQKKLRALEIKVRDTNISHTRHQLHELFKSQPKTRMGDSSITI
ncbi:MAG: hypothetical protein V7K25_19650 [Nostoc sp.]|uniref:hypothetical protein n=1 Tax=Nostoc sp. TaxID=1180 RepID=UPI002FF9AB58